jgi:hypothetical protein
MKKKYFSSHKLPKQQLTSFWSQGILGVKDRENPTWRRILDGVGCSFALLRRVCWPALEECYVCAKDYNFVVLVVSCGGWLGLQCLKKEFPSCFLLS